MYILLQPAVSLASVVPMATLVCPVCTVRPDPTEHPAVPAPRPTLPASPNESSSLLRVYLVLRYVIIMLENAFTVKIILLLSDKQANKQTNIPTSLCRDLADLLVTPDSLETTEDLECRASRARTDPAEDPESPDRLASVVCLDHADLLETRVRWNIFCTDRYEEHQIVRKQRQYINVFDSRSHTRGSRHSRTSWRCRRARTLGTSRSPGINWRGRLPGYARREGMAWTARSTRSSRYRWACWTRRRGGTRWYARYLRLPGHRGRHARLVHYPCACCRTLPTRFSGEG